MPRMDEDSSDVNTAIGRYVVDRVKEIKDFDIGIAHLQVQTPWLGLAISSSTQQVNALCPSSPFVSLAITNGALSLGQGFATDVFVCLQEDPAQSSPSSASPSSPPRRMPKVVELLVTLQGVRRSPEASLSRPASHVSGQPRAGDALSPVRSDALRAALEGHGLALEALLTSPDFHASSARRTCLTFINPRPNRVPNRVEPLEQSAARCAQQVHSTRCAQQVP